MIIHFTSSISDLPTGFSHTTTAPPSKKPLPGRSRGKSGKVKKKQSIEIEDCPEEMMEGRYPSSVSVPHNFENSYLKLKLHIHFIFKKG